MTTQNYGPVCEIESTPVFASYLQSVRGQNGAVGTFLSFDENVRMVKSGWFLYECFLIWFMFCATKCASNCEKRYKAQLAWRKAEFIQFYHLVWIFTFFFIDQHFVLVHFNKSFSTFDFWWFPGLVRSLKHYPVHLVLILLHHCNICPYYNMALWGVERASFNHDFMREDPVTHLRHMQKTEDITNSLCTKIFKKEGFLVHFRPYTIDNASDHFNYNVDSWLITGQLKFTWNCFVCVHMKTAASLV